MDHLRDGVGLQGYGQKDPIVVYKMEAFKFFGMMMAAIGEDVVKKLFAVQVAAADSTESIDEEMAREEAALTGGGNFQYNLTEDGELVPTQKGAAAAPAAAKAPPIDLSHLHKAPRQMQMSRGPMQGGALAGAGGPFAQPQSAGGPSMGGGFSSGNDVDKVGRNDPCPCGSGKKYKKCHGLGS
jgi:preprotein translocase subunit SecA